MKQSFEEVNQRQNEIISKLERVQGVFQDILAKDKQRLVIQYKEREKLGKLLRKNENMLKKFKSHEFTVAVVGLEKAGKSTLANALLQLIVLPEYSERCTYTTTEIRSGKNDVAEVYFYGKDIFEKNFAAMLEEVGYLEKINFEELQVEDFEKYWENVKNNQPALFQKFNGTTVEDIRTMLTAKDVICYLLDKDHETLDINNTEEYQILYRYITGIENYTAGHVERTAEPYAVEKIIIKSTNLADMQNIVLYDVPGFDSPTDLHKRQTEEMLKIADAIILVTNVGDRPNLTGTQLDMLQKVHDEDGISLADKVFVFGNKLDMAGTPQIAKDNISALTHDAIEKYAISKTNRVVCGSAKAYLERKGKLSQDDKNRGTRNISVVLSNWGITDGVEELKAKMQSYYDIDRFEILKRRAEKNIADIKIFLSNILSAYEDANVEGGEQYLLQAKDSLEEFSKKAGVIEREYLEKINSDAFFSNLVHKSIEEIFPNEDENSLHVKNAENLGSSGESYALSRIDALSRENLSFTFKKNIAVKMASLALEKEKELYNFLAENLLENLGIEENSQYLDDLKQSAQKLFKNFLIDSGEHCDFNPLVERYMTGLIDVLIRSPYASKERLNKLTSIESISDFQSLAVYFNADCFEEKNLSVTDKVLYFFARILTHNEFFPPSAEDNERNLRKFFKEYDANLAAGFDFEKLPFETWSVILAKIGIKVAESDLLPRLKQALINFVGVQAWSQMSPKAKNDLLNSAIIKYCVSESPPSLNNWLEIMNKQIQPAETKEKMLLILNEDIDMLREITINSALKAIGLERAFTSIMSKNIELIRESIHNSDGQQIFNSWLKENLRKIKESEYATIDKNMEIFKLKQEIANSIRPMLDALDG